MKKALIVRFLIVIAIVMSVCVVSATALLSSTEQNVRKSDMLTSLGLIRVIYEDEADHDYDLANRLSSLVGNARVSFINKDGTVFVDTYIDGEPDDNHSTREEIKQAELTGSGVAVRYSKTLGKNQIYAAMKVKDDDIIRISYNKQLYGFCVNVHSAYADSRRNRHNSRTYSGQQCRPPDNEADKQHIKGYERYEICR